MPRKTWPPAKAAPRRLPCATVTMGSVMGVLRGCVSEGILSEVDCTIARLNHDPDCSGPVTTGNSRTRWLSRPKHRPNVDQTSTPGRLPYVPHRVGGGLAHIIDANVRGH